MTLLDESGPENEEENVPPAASKKKKRNENRVPLKERKGFSEFFPKLGTLPETKKRKTILEQVPGPVYTSQEAMEVIKKRDKNSSDKYVKEYERDVEKGIQALNKNENGRNVAFKKDKKGGKKSKK